MGIGEIAEGLRNGDSDTIVFVFRKLLPNIVSMLSKNNAQSWAEELTWTGISIYWEKCQNPEFVIQGSPIAYIFRICRNKWVDHLKSNNKLLETLVVDYPELPFNYHNPFDEYPELWELVETELKQMRKSCQDIIRLRRETDKYDIIISQLNISYENARYRYSVCLAELTKRIQKNKKTTN